MSLKPPVVKRELTPQGVHRAACYLVCDIGTQTLTWEGNEKDVHQVVIGWELPDQRITLEGRDLPKATSRTYTLTYDERGWLRRHLEAWRGKAFTDDDVMNFDLKTILGAPCQVQVIHKPTRKGGMFASVESVMAMPHGSPKIPLENEPQYFSFDEFYGSNARIPENIPKWIVEKIHESAEWRKYEQSNMANGEQDVGHTEPYEQEPPEEDLSNEEDSDFLPF